MFPHPTREVCLAVGVSLVTSCSGGGGGGCRGCRGGGGSLHLVHSGL